MSPSGTGVRAFYHGGIADRKNNEVGIETFCRKGFLTITGESLNGSGLLALPEAVADELARRMGLDRKNGAGTNGANGTNEEDFKNSKLPPVSIEIIRKALSFIPADDRERWVCMGMAVKSEHGDAGFEV